MTIESPLAHHRPPDDFNPRLKFNSNRENSTSPTPCFHDYARRRRHSRSPPPLVRPKMSSEYRGPQVALRPLYMATPDHALTDLSTCPATSPEYMYEDGTGRDTKGVLLSPCTSDGYHGDALPCDDDDEAGLATCDASWGQLDGPPLQDYLCDIINGDDGSSIKDIGDALVACIGSTEEPVRILGLKDAKRSSGPTLAQLNDRESVLDVILAPPGGGTQRWVPQTAVTTAPAPATTDAWTNGFYSPARPAIARTVSSSATLASSGMLAYHNAAHTPASSLQELLTAAPDTNKAAKRPREDNDDEDGRSDGSMERKWEEIRCYIDSNIKLEEEAAAAVTGRPTHTSDANNNHATTMATVAKRIKVEPQDTVPEAFTSPPSQYTTPTTPTLKHSPADNQEYPTVKEEPESDYDNSDDDFSDIDSDASYGSFVEDLLHGSNTKKEKRYFWQYNTQSKGPKGKRLCKSITEPDPHSLADFEDPVFQPDVNDARYKHNGKARKGDGNDITPNSWKLFQIGNELQKLNKKINGIAMTEKPQRSRDGVKSKSRKEKNKFASRACRLKKKAQHEANKLKLFGLEQEHYQLMEVLKTVKAYVYSRIKHNTIEPAEKTFTAMLEDEIKNNLTVMIGGNTSDYVNAVLQKVAEGDKTGGIHRA